MGCVVCGLAPKENVANLLVAACSTSSDEPSSSIWRGEINGEGSYTALTPFREGLSPLDPLPLDRSRAWARGMLSSLE
jgi:hypothetical protein